MKSIELKGLVGSAYITPEGRMLGIIKSARADDNGATLKITIQDDLVKRLIRESVHDGEKIGGN